MGEESIGEGGVIKNFFLLCGLTFLVLYNLKLSGSPVSYVPFRPSPNLASIIRRIFAN